MTDERDPNDRNPSSSDPTGSDASERERGSSTQWTAAPSGNGQPRPGYRETLRAGPDLADIAVSLLLALFPEHQLYRAEAGAMTAISLDPALDADQAARLEHFLQALVERPEWRERHGVLREVRDRAGTRLEVRTPTAPADYVAGEALVGPFDDEAAADTWGAGHAPSGFGHDAIRMAGAWLCDVFDAGEDLGPAWEPGPTN
ncbi:MAG: hypothetical protein R6W77_16885 [Trueperaceae bacterium]